MDDTFSELTARASAIVVMMEVKEGDNWDLGGHYRSVKSGVLALELASKLTLELTFTLEFGLRLFLGLELTLKLTLTLALKLRWSWRLSWSSG